MSNFQFSIINLNVNGFRSRQKELQHFTSALKTKSVLVLTDTRLRKDSKFDIFKGYNIIRRDKPAIQNCRTTAGGLAFLVPCEWDLRRKIFLKEFAVRI